MTFMPYGDNESCYTYKQFCLYSVCDMTVQFYGCETWMLNEDKWAKVQAIHMRCQRRILTIKWNDFIPNVTVAVTSGLDSIINIARARRLGLFGHVARFSRGVPASITLLHIQRWPSLCHKARVRRACTYDCVRLWIAISINEDPVSYPRVNYVCIRY